MTRVAIVGGSGRMGQAISQGLAACDDVEVVALVDPHEPSAPTTSWVARIEDLDAKRVDVVVDFSLPDVTRTVVAWCLDHGVAAVVGTTGLASDDLENFARLAGSVGHVIVASNFSVGAVLADRFARQAAAYFDRVEIIELHHDRKLDAPSGTSQSTARAIAEARRAAGLDAISDVTERETLAHARGAEGDGGVRIHSVRLPGLTAHQEVIFGRAGEGLTIRHDSYDRQSFVAGVVLAVRAVRDRPGLTIGIDDLV